EITTKGEVKGRILDKPEGENGFGYDPVFYCPELGKTFAQADSDEKNSVSHRGRALRALYDELKSVIGNKQ
ncbi:MAG: non-canonical purine NTP pyrophosphatase, partial [Candidatus Ornithomonoglobus sp.]